MATVEQESDGTTLEQVAIRGDADDMRELAFKVLTAIETGQSKFRLGGVLFRLHCTDREGI